MSISMKRCAVVAAAIASISALGPTASAQAQTTTGGWAVLNSDGHLLSGSNVVAAGHIGTGAYKIRFNQDVSACAASATLAVKNGKSVAPGYVIIGHGDQNPDAIHVLTYESVTLLPADYKFSVIVAC